MMKLSVQQKKTRKSKKVRVLEEDEVRMRAYQAYDDAYREFFSVFQANPDSLREDPIGTWIIGHTQIFRRAFIEYAMQCYRYGEDMRGEFPLMNAYLPYFESKVSKILVERLEKVYLNQREGIDGF